LQSLLKKYNKDKKSFPMHSFGFGIDQWKICNWHECQGCESLLQEGDRVAIEALLHSFDSVQLRQLAVRCDDFLLSGISSHLDDYKLTRWLVSQFTSGRLRICKLPTQAKTSTAGAASSAAAQPEPPQSQPRKRTTASASTPTPSPADTQTFPSNFDAVAAAKVLKEAAKDGVPFCEECMKAARAKSSS
jgi:hypothetical protein